MMTRELIDFTEEEIRARVALCREHLVRDGLSGLVVTAAANLYYYTGWRIYQPYDSFTRPTFLFIPAEGEPVMYAQILFRADVEASAKGCRFRFFPDVFGPKAEELKEIFCDLGMDRGKVGFELGYEQRLIMQIDLYEALKKALPAASFADASTLIWEQRMVKSETELACVKAAVEATDLAFERAVPQMHEGMSEVEAWRLIQCEMLRAGAELPSGTVVLSERGSYERGCKIAGNRKFKKDDYLWFDLSAKFCGYTSDFCRGAVVGEVSDERRRLYEMAVEVTEKAAEELRPGAPVAAAASRIADEMTKRGYVSNFEAGRFGHGSGLQITEPPSVMLRDNTILKPGMIVHLEPGIVTDDGIFVVEEMYHITESGCERLTNAPRELISIG